MEDGAAAATKVKREQPVRAVYENGECVALVQSRSDDAAVRAATNGRFTARIVNGMELANLAKTLTPINADEIKAK